MLQKWIVKYQKSEFCSAGLHMQYLFDSPRVVRICWGCGTAALLQSDWPPECFETEILAIQRPCLDTQYLHQVFFKFLFHWICIQHCCHFSLEDDSYLFMPKEWTHLSRSQSTTKITPGPKSKLLHHCCITQLLHWIHQTWRQNMKNLVPTKFDRNLQILGSVFGCSMLMSPSERQFTSLLKLSYLPTRRQETHTF